MSWRNEPIPIPKLSGIVSHRPNGSTKAAITVKGGEKRYKREERDYNTRRWRVGVKDLRRHPALFSLLFCCAWGLFLSVFFFLLLLLLLDVKRDPKRRWWSCSTHSTHTHLLQTAERPITWWYETPPPHSIRSLRLSEQPKKTLRLMNSERAQIAGRQSPGLSISGWALLLKGLSKKIKGKWVKSATRSRVRETSIIQRDFRLFYGTRPPAAMSQCQQLYIYSNS